jgi:hypothetical protein
MAEGKMPENGDYAEGSAVGSKIISRGWQIVLAVIMLAGFVGIAMRIETGIFSETVDRKISDLKATLTDQEHGPFVLRTVATERWMAADRADEQLRQDLAACRVEVRDLRDRAEANRKAIEEIRLNEARRR